MQSPQACEDDTERSYSTDQNSRMMKTFLRKISLIDIVPGSLSPAALRSHQRSSQVVQYFTAFLNKVKNITEAGWELKLTTLLFVISCWTGELFN